ncbi:3-isopropylmalate dehydratase large subunit [Trichinella pseudospiralis]
MIPLAIPTQWWKQLESMELSVQDKHISFQNSENSNPWASWPMKKNYTIYEDEVKFGFLETSCLPNEDHIMMQGGLKQPEYTAVTMVIEVPVRKNLWKTCWSTAGRMTAGR